MNSVILREMQEDFNYIRRRTECLERKLIDLDKMNKTLKEIQNREDCTEEIFILIEKCCIK